VKTSRLFLFWLTLVNLFGFSDSNAFAQPRITKTADGRLLSGPDPNSVFEMFREAVKTPSIQTFLALSDDEIDGASKIYEILKEKQRIAFKALDEPERTATIKAIREEGSNLIEEVLSPDKARLLRAIGYRLEVERSGIGHALCEGRLGGHVGTHDQQHEQILSAAEELERTISREIAKVKKFYTEKFLEETLAPEQRDRAKNALSETYSFVEASEGRAFFRQILTDRENKRKSQENKEARRP
jgi:hypothetical protein